MSRAHVPLSWRRRVFAVVLCVAAAATAQAQSTNALDSTGVVRDESGGVCQA